MDMHADDHKTAYELDDIYAVVGFLFHSAEFPLRDIGYCNILKGGILR